MVNSKKNTSIINFLEKVDSTHFHSENSQYFKCTSWDNDLGEYVIKEFRNHKIKTLLDVACGKGDFVELCVDNGITAFGIEPLISKPGILDKPIIVRENGIYKKLTTEHKVHPNIYKGTFDTIVENQRFLEGIKFDCITIFNTLHGNWQHSNKLSNVQINILLLKIFNFLKNNSKYIIISDPTFSTFHWDKKKKVLKPNIPYWANTKYKDMIEAEIARMETKNNKDSCFGNYISKTFKTRKELIEYFYDGLSLVTEFPGSHGGKTCIHKLYKVVQ